MNRIFAEVQGNAVHNEDTEWQVNVRDTSHPRSLKPEFKLPALGGQPMAKFGIKTSFAAMTAAGR